MNETANLLMNAAEARIRQKGYNAVSFRDLADELGIKSASVHYYFRQKEDLACALVERYSDVFFAAVEGRLGKNAKSLEKVDAYVDAYRAALYDADAICLCGMLGAEFTGLPQPVAERVAGFFQANIDWLTNALPREWSGKKRTRRAGQLLATLQGAMMLANTLGDRKIFDRACKSLASDMGLV